MVVVDQTCTSKGLTANTAQASLQVTMRDVSASRVSPAAGAQEGEEDMVRLLVQFGARLEDHDEDHETALLVASSMGHTAVSPGKIVFQNHQFFSRKKHQ